MLPRIELLAETNRQERIAQIRDQGESNSLNQLIDLIEAQFLGRFSRNFIRSNMTQFFDRLGLAADDDIVREFARQQISVAPTAADVEVLEAAIDTATNNLNNINETLLNDIRNEISSGLQSGDRWEEIGRRLTRSFTRAAKEGEAQTPFRKAFNRAKFQARNTVGTALGKINEERQVSAGIDLYIWQTAEDERVRETHVDLGTDVNGGIPGLHAWRPGVRFNGEEIPVASDPKFNNGAPTFPGEPFNCRCVALPFIPELEDIE